MTILPLNLLVNFRAYKYEMDYYLKNPDVDTRNREYSNLTKLEQIDNAQIFINKLCKECESVQYSTALNNMVNEFNNFYTTYREDIPNDYLSLQSFVCMVSNILNVLSKDILNYFLNYDFSYKKILDMIDSSVSINEKILNYRTLISDIFLSRTIFSSNSNIKYIAKGANGGVDIISLTNGTDKFNVIEKYMLPDGSDDVSELLNLLRELIISSEILFNVRQYTPNFTTIYGMYVSYDSVPYGMDDAIIDTYISSRPSISSTLSFLKNINIYEKIDESGSLDRVVGNLDASSKKIYLLTEYAPGNSLSDYIYEIVKDNDVDKAINVIEILLQIFRSLIFAYNKIGYRHNDLHIENVIVSTLKDKIHIPEIVDPKDSTFGHNSQNVKHLAQIIDYGYSSINDYVKYFYSIFSDGQTTVHSDIIRIYTSIMKHLYYLKLDLLENETLYTILKYLTLTVSSYYFNDHTKYKFTDDPFAFSDLLVDYERSGLVDEFESVTFDNNELLIKSGYSTGVNFYEYMIQQINNLTTSEKNKIGLSTVADNQLYDNVGIQQRATYVPAIDINNEKIFKGELPYGLGLVDIDSIYDTFNNICYEIDFVNSNVTNELQRAEIFTFLYISIYTLSKYIGFYTFLGQYGEVEKYTDAAKVELSYKYITLMKNTIPIIKDQIWDSRSLDNGYIINKLSILDNILTYFS